MIKKPTPLEKHEQIALAGWLDAINVIYCHIPNERMVNHLKTNGAKFAYLNSLKRQGFKKGVPDILIFTRPPIFDNYVGVAIEMKRYGKVPTEDQNNWLQDLTNCDWLTRCCNQGTDEAIIWLKSLGYGVRRKA